MFIKRFKKLVGAGEINSPQPQPVFPSARVEGELIEISGLEKAYATPAGPFWALKGVDLTISRGEFVAIQGKSGAGKSTLINMIAGIDRPTAGEIWVGGFPVHQLTEETAARWRSQQVGVVFQHFQLMPMLSCLENVMMPMDFANKYGKIRARRERAMELLEQMDIGEHAFKPPAAVSGGQRQRVAIARALANDPDLIVADEPTGNLDSQTADAVFRLFRFLVREGKTILMVTHDREVVQKVDRTLILHDGQWQTG
ncbi:MAG: ABC transporter ATP-binding protein [Ardenticatenaceae bacterium]|nr:ABC transporter ATP-binding protein [Ardenticatenaceae bacterium]